MSKIKSVFGELVFSKDVMREKLSKDVYDKLIKTIESGEPLDITIASDVAHAMKEWAISKGATHFTHWFQPQRGGTAEKHDSFISYAENGNIIERFSSKQLIQSEPDASSFPSGGIRSTFEARGYTAWDPTSPAFLQEIGETKTLVIPSVFLSWTGDVLDLKTPFLRSIRVLNEVVLKFLRTIGYKDAKKIIVYAGPEQEYFVIDRKLAETRPDLLTCGRTLFGAPPAKGQQMEDHYFGSIHPRIMKFMEELDKELYRRGIPAKTRHNEVSPNQFELAPLYEEANLAIDHNLIMMDIMKKVAWKHGLEVILHEKPFAGVNGSGKHINYSIGDDTGANYLELTNQSPIKNITFLSTLAALLIGVDKYGNLLRASVADAGNDHRLGANEAPPAIMSVYLGEYLSNLIDEIAELGRINAKDIEQISMGLKNLPKIARDYSDRNRTSPLAFTGNKFEFRAVGASQNPSEAITTLNLLIAHGFYILEKRFNSIFTPSDPYEKVFAVLRDVFIETKRIRFEGNCYSDEWKAEAAKRGLPIAINTPQALKAYLDPHVVELYTKTKTLSERELKAKYEIKLEHYIKTKEIELKIAIDMAKTRYLPAIYKHLSLLSQNAIRLKELGMQTSIVDEDLNLFNKIIEDLKSQIKNTESVLNTVHSYASHEQQAEYLADQGEKALLNLRKIVDFAEQHVSHEFWPVAKYSELMTKL